MISSLFELELTWLKKPKKPRKPHIADPVQSEDFLCLEKKNPKNTNSPHLGPQSSLPSWPPPYPFLTLFTTPHDTLSGVGASATSWMETRAVSLPCHIQGSLLTKVHLAHLSLMPLLRKFCPIEETTISCLRKRYKCNETLQLTFQILENTKGVLHRELQAWSHPLDFHSQTQCRLGSCLELW